MRSSASWPGEGASVVGRAGDPTGASATMPTNTRRHVWSLRVAHRSHHCPVEAAAVVGDLRGSLEARRHEYGAIRDPWEGLLAIAPGQVDQYALRTALPGGGRGPGRGGGPRR